MKLIEKKLNKIFRKEAWKKTINQQDIIVNEENYEAYDNLYQIKNNSDSFIYGNKKLSKVFNSCINVLAISCSLICFVLSIKLGSVDTTLGVAVAIPSVVIIPSLILDLGYAINKRQNLSNFALDYPDIDTNIDSFELELALENYNNKTEDNCIEEEKEEYVDKETFKNCLKEKYKALRDEIINNQQLKEENVEKNKAKSYHK